MIELDKIYAGDNLATMRTWPEKFVQTCVTSPPYFGLRDYGHEGQIGLDDTPEAFIARLVDVFREVKRVLRDDGTLWLNLGDSWAGSWAGSGGNQGRKSTRGGQRPVNGPMMQKVDDKRYPTTGANTGSLSKTPGCKNKDLIGIPWMAAFALRADGWYLRSDIIWEKSNPMPEPVTDRPGKAHEYIFLLSKSKKYFYDHKAIKEPVAPSTVGRGKVDFGGAKGRKTAETLDPSDPRFRGTPEGTQWGNTFDYTKSCAEGRNKRTVWRTSTSTYRGAHFATFPPQLIEPCILAGAGRGGVVLDPFTGAGTTGLVAARHGRRYVGCERNPAYVKLAEDRITNEIFGDALRAL